MKKVLFMLLLAGSALAAHAQFPVSGTVRDADTGEPLPSAVVREAGKPENGTLTDEEGKFELEVSDGGASLSVSMLEFQDTEFEIEGKSNLELQLVPGEPQDEVVITAIGIPREKKALGYGIQEIKSSEINTVRDPNLLNNLSGRVAGVQITNGSSGVGSSTFLTIRGQSSLSGSNQALFVVDGIPISNTLITNNTENDATGFQEVDYGNGAGEINPDDIESVTVLKGPAATALYGSRAANGVVVIQTKTGEKSKGMGISLNSSVTFDKPLVQRQYQNEYGQGEGGLFQFEDGLNGGVNDGEIESFGPKIDGQLIRQFDSPSTDVNGNPVRGGDVVARNGNPISPTPWIAQPNNVRDFWETGVTLVNNMAVTGSDEKGHYRLSYTNVENSGIMPNTGLHRNSLALSGGYRVSEKLTARTYINYLRTTSENRPGLGYGSENPMYTFTWMGRQVNVDNLRDYWQAGQEGINQFNYNYAWMDNPYLTSYENTNAFEKDRLLGNLALSYQFNPNLSLQLRSGMDTYQDLRSSRRAFSSQRFRNGAYREDAASFREMNSDFLLRYERDLNDDFDFSIGLGGNRMDQRSRYLSVTAGELSVPNIYNFQNTRIPLVSAQYVQTKRINSLYGLGTLAWRNSIYLETTVRNDWSSTLPAGNNSYAYYSASLSAVLSDLFVLPDFIDFAKLRLSTASVGNDTDPYNLNETFLFTTPYGSNPAVSGSPVLPNRNLRPERLNAFEVGADVRLFKNRIGLDLNWYRNIGKDQIIELPTSTPSGYTSRVVNGGKIRSQGIEAILNLTPVKTNDFQWNSWFNFTRNVSIVEELPDGIDQYVVGFARVYERSDRAVYFIAQEGGRMGDMYGTGLLEVDGRQVYDQNGNPVKDPNLRLLGNYNPDFILGWGNEINYKGIHFGFLFDWRQGGTIVSRTKAIASTSGVLESTLEGRENGVVGDGIVNIGTEENPIYQENTTAIGAQDYYNQYFDRDNEANALYDASFVKLREVRIGWNVPETWVSKWKLTHVRLSLIARNLALWTENPHFDPETTTMQGRNFAFGVEDMAYPSTRNIGVSLQIGL